MFFDFLVLKGKETIILLCLSPNTHPFFLTGRVYSNQPPLSAIPCFRMTKLLFIPYLFFNLSFSSWI